MNCTFAVLRLTLAAGAFAALMGVCPRPTVAADEGAKITFQDHALPILRQRCGSCHDPDSKTAGLDVTSFVGIMQGGGSGEVITPGDASGSYLFRLVTHEDEPTMPPDSAPIPQAEQDVLRKWIDGAVLENEGSVAMVPLCIYGAENARLRSEAVRNANAAFTPLSGTLSFGFSGTPSVCG